MLMTYYRELAWEHVNQLIHQCQQVRSCPHLKEHHWDRMTTHNTEA
jgi:hypothetical protein